MFSFIRKNITISMGNIHICNGGVRGTEGNALKKFDERRSQEANDVEKIVIDSSVDVYISASNSSIIETHFYGEAYTSGNAELNVNVVNNELVITLKLNGNFYNGDLELDVMLPNKKFKEISVQTLSADIVCGDEILTEKLKVKAVSGDLELSKEVSAENLEVQLTSGDLETSALFNTASVTMQSGDVDMYINPKNDVDVKISTMSGDVDVELENIGQLNLSTNSLSGDIMNCHEGGKGYTANIAISTMSGDITIE